MKMFGSALMIDPVAQANGLQEAAFLKSLQELVIMARMALVNADTLASHSVNCIHSADGLGILNLRCGLSVVDAINDQVKARLTFLGE